VAFRLRKDEPVAKGLKRVVNKELRSAVEELRGAERSDIAIHEARKSIKKVRAVLQLVGDDIGGRGDMKRLRRTGRALAPLRDADAMLATARKLCARERRSLSGATCSAMGDVLLRHKARVKSVARRDRVAPRAADALAKVRRSARDWPVKKIGFTTIVEAITRSYKKARRAMEAAQTGRRADLVHTWRKRVKALWYALRLLERRLPALRPLLADLNRLEEWLGEDHNLLMLRTQIASDRRLHPLQTNRTRIKTLAGRRQEDLRRKALPLGARVFKDTPKAFERHLRRMWKKSRRAARQAA
jgi:CHAD domain